MLDTFLAPIRERRLELCEDYGYLERVLKEGTEVAFEKAAQTLQRQKEAMGLKYDFLLSIGV